VVERELNLLGTEGKLPKAVSLNGLSLNLSCGIRHLAGGYTLRP